jgi:hypothetical protein
VQEATKKSLKSKLEAATNEPIQKFIYNGINTTIFFDDGSLRMAATAGGYILELAMKCINMMGKIIFVLETK